MCKSITSKCVLMGLLVLLVPAITIAVYSNNAQTPAAAIPMVDAAKEADPLHPAVISVADVISEAQLANWDISVFYDGENLPEGKGTLEEGEIIYQAQCAMCHGEFGEGAQGYPKMLGAPMDEFIETAVNGEDNISVRGINNLWASAPTLYDFIRRAMPFFAPQSLTDDQAYAVTGYVLQLAEVIEDDPEFIDAAYLKAIEMPGAGNYYTDTRPDTQNVRCMQDCYDYAPQIKGSSVEGDISTGSVAKRNKS